MSKSNTTRQSPQTPNQVVRLLADVRKGRGLQQFQWVALKSAGYIGGTIERPVFTAKGRRLLKATVYSPDVEAGHDQDPLKIPDTLERLANPRNSGKSLVEPSDLAAASRLSLDLEKAGIRQRITQSWSLSALGHGGTRGVQLNGGETAVKLDAQDRVQKACRALGPEFSDLLIDICLYEKTLTVIESERQWPKGSAKLALVLALRMLARHYGLSRVASGPDFHQRPIELTG